MESEKEVEQERDGGKKDRQERKRGDGRGRVVWKERRGRDFMSYQHMIVHNKY